MNKQDLMQRIADILLQITSVHHKQDHVPPRFLYTALLEAFEVIVDQIAQNENPVAAMGGMSHATDTINEDEFCIRCKHCVHINIEKMSCQSQDQPNA